MSSPEGEVRRGRIYAGTSGFSYPAWAPTFYPAGTRTPDLLAAYGSRLNAVELNNTFYQHPTMARIQAWRAQIPDSFRFTVKAQKGGAIRALRSDPQSTVPWLTAPYRWFGDQLGTVLFRLPDAVPRDDDALARLLDVWPATMPLTLEFQHPSWQDDAVHSLLRKHEAVLCATDLEDRTSPPDLRLTGPFLYLRLRRETYDPAAMESWAARLEPFLHDGRDAFVFFRHDETGRSALLAEALAERLNREDLWGSPQRSF